nr:hypothetical protein [Tanacetum cinerariifolium]
MTIETHNWASSAHQELHKIVREEIFPIVNQVDTRLQNFQIQFLKEAAKFVRDFKSLAKEADDSLAKHKALELDIERLLKVVVSRDIMIIVQNESVVDTSDLQTELEQLRVNCYCDAGFETDRDDTKYQTGYVFVLNGGVVMNCDNSAAIIMTKESGIQKGARHFKRKYHYVRECIETSEINIVKVHTYNNLADPFTKALAGPKLTRHTRSMGLRPASSFM